MANNIPIDIMHAKRLDSMLLQQLLLRPINVAQPNIHQLPLTDQMVLFQPAEDILPLFRRQPSQESKRHSVDIPTIAVLRDINISMRINPYHRNLTPKSLPRSLGYTRHGPDGNRVVTT